MHNRIYLSLILFVVTSGAVMAQGTMPRWEKYGNYSGTKDNLFEIDDDNWGNDATRAGYVEGAPHGTWLLFGRQSYTTTESPNADRQWRRIGFIATEDLYHDWAPYIDKREGNKRSEAMYFGFMYITSAIDFTRRTRTNVMTITKDSRVGINTPTPLAKLDIQNQSSVAAMAFQYKDGGYRHWISTRHSNVLNSNENAIDFYINNSSTNDGYLAPGSGSVLGMSITATGVGIGTDRPSTKLEVVAKGSRGSTGGILMDGDQKSPWISTVLKVSNGDNTTSDYRGRFAINQWGLDGYSHFKHPFLNIETNDANMPIFFSVSDSITMQLYQDRVLIGGALPLPISDVTVPFPGMDYTLGVRGRILASGLTCKDLSQWADFVFDADYSLKPLEQVADYVAENKHLPDVPSAHEVANNGIDVPEMLKTQMQKIEELMLYTIEQEKQLATQEVLINRLQKQLGRKKQGLQ